MQFENIRMFGWMFRVFFCVCWLSASLRREPWNKKTTFKKRLSNSMQFTESAEQIFIYYFLVAIYSTLAIALPFILAWKFCRCFSISLAHSLVRSLACSPHSFIHFVSTYPVTYTQLFIDMMMVMFGTISYFDIYIQCSSSVGIYECVCASNRYSCRHTQTREKKRVCLFLVVTNLGIIRGKKAKRKTTTTNTIMCPRAHTQNQWISSMLFQFTMLILFFSLFFLSTWSCFFFVCKMTWILCFSIYAVVYLLFLLPHSIPYINSINFASIRSESIPRFLFGFAFFPLARSKKYISFITSKLSVYK